MNKNVLMALQMKPYKKPDMPFGWDKVPENNYKEAISEWPDVEYFVKEKEGKNLYLVSSNGAYINPNIGNGTRDIELETDYIVLSQKEPFGLYGQYASGIAFRCWIEAGGKQLFTFNGDNQFYLNPNCGYLSNCLLKIQDEYIYIWNKKVKKITKNSGVGGYRFLILEQIVNGRLLSEWSGFGVNHVIAMRYFYLSCSLGDRFFVPFYRNGEYGALDLINMVFYKNAKSSGEFSVEFRKSI